MHVRRHSAAHNKNECNTRRSWRSSRAGAAAAAAAVVVVEKSDDSGASTFSMGGVQQTIAKSNQQLSTLLS